MDFSSLDWMTARSRSGEKILGLRHIYFTTLRGESGPGRDNGMGPVKAFALNANGSALYAGTSNGQIVCWEKERYSSSQMPQIDILGGPQHAILSLATGGNNLLFSGSADATICTWISSDSGSIPLSVPFFSEHYIFYWVLYSVFYSVYWNLTDSTPGSYGRQGC